MGASEGFEKGGSGLCVGSFILVGGQRLRKQVEADLGVLERRKERLNQGLCQRDGGREEDSKKTEASGRYEW